MCLPAPLRPAIGDSLSSFTCRVGEEGKRTVKESDGSSNGENLRFEFSASKVECNCEADRSSKDNEIISAERDLLYSPRE